MSAKKLSAYAPLFAALGDETRLSLVAKLADGETHSISSLSEGKKISRQAVSKHLSVLEDAGLVKSVRRGRENLFEFRAAPVDDLKQYLEAVSAQWGDALLRLKDFVER